MPSSSAWQDFNYANSHHLQQVIPGISADSNGNCSHCGWSAGGGPMWKWSLAEAQGLAGDVVNIKTDRYLVLKFLVALMSPQKISTTVKKLTLKKIK